MKKIILITLSVFLLSGLSVINAQSSCCNKGMKKTSCDKEMKASCDKDKMSYDSAKGNKVMSFKVAGNCGMCEDRIEKAALGVKGVKTAEWDKDTKVLKLTYESGVLKKDIEKAIAAAGHDTPDFKASKEKYDGLPACCKYERM